MALVAPVENGKIVETASQTSVSNSTKTSSNGMDKEAFLQLLVAQMKYQDPLEPTSNTEYISQYAQFSQVEQMQNMSSSMDLQRASSLVGKEVYIKTTTSSGDTKLVQGRVDYVSYENNKAYLYINEQKYSIDDLDSVVDTDYLNAYNSAYNFTVKLNKLPNVNGIDSSDGETIDELEKEYNEMSDYEKSFLAKDTVTSLNKYIERLQEIRKAAEEAKKDTEDTESKDEAGETEGTEETDSTESV